MVEKCQMPPPYHESWLFRRLCDSDEARVQVTPGDYSLFTMAKVTREVWSSRKREHPRDPCEWRTQCY